MSDRKEVTRMEGLLREYDSAYSFIQENECEGKILNLVHALTEERDAAKDEAERARKNAGLAVAIANEANAELTAQLTAARAEVERLKTMLVLVGAAVKDKDAEVERLKAELAEARDVILSRMSDG